MTHKEDLLKRLERANPVPEPNRLYTDSEESRRFSHLVEKRRKGMDDTKVRPIKSGDKPPNRGILVAAATFVIVVGIGIGIALLVSGDEGSDVAGVPAPTSAPEATTATAAVAVTFDGTNCSYEGPAEWTMTDEFTLGFQNDSTLVASAIVTRVDLDWGPDPNLVGTDFEHYVPPEVQPGFFFTVTAHAQPGGDGSTVEFLTVPGTYVVDCQSFENATPSHVWRTATIEVTP